MWTLTVIQQMVDRMKIYTNKKMKRTRKDFTNKKAFTSGLSVSPHFGKHDKYQS